MLLIRTRVVLIVSQSCCLPLSLVSPSKIKGMWTESNANVTRTADKTADASNEQRSDASFSERNIISTAQLTYSGQ